VGVSEKNRLTGVAAKYLLKRRLCRWLNHDCQVPLVPVGVVGRLGHDPGQRDIDCEERSVGPLEVSRLRL